MRPVIALLWIKIVGTLLFAALPLLLVPEPLYLWLGFPPQPTLLFLRLYGLSTLALLVGYHGGIELARAGQFPRGVLRMGLVSNGGQGLAILIAGVAGTCASWGWMAQAMIYGLGLFILAIAAAIVVLQRRHARDGA